MGILDDARREPMKNKESVGPAIRKLPPEDQEDVHTAILDNGITDTYVANWLNKKTGSSLTYMQVGHYRRSRLARKQDA